MYSHSVVTWKAFFWAASVLVLHPMYPVLQSSIHGGDHRKYKSRFFSLQTLFTSGGEEAELLQSGPA